jgi:hypothetical protein
MYRTLLLAAILGLAAAAVVTACKPAADTFDAGCYPAPISTPDGGGGDAGCTPWSGGCPGQDGGNSYALQTAIQNAFNANGSCQSVTDCGLYAAYGTQFKMQCFQSYDLPAINLSQRGALDQQLNSILCGFCNACFSADAGGGVFDTDPEPPQDAGNCTEVQCNSGLCYFQNFQL